MFKKFFTLSFITYFSALSWGADWLHLGTNDIAAHYIDQSSKTIIDGPIIQFWIKYVYSSRQYTKNNQLPFDEVMVLSEVNCADKTTRSIEETFYYKGDSISRITTPSYYARIIPDTVGDAQFKAVCTEELINAKPSNYTNLNSNSTTSIDNYSPRGKMFITKNNSNIRTCATASCASLGIIPFRSQVYPLYGNSGNYITYGNWIAVQYTGQFCGSDSDYNCSHRTRSRTVKGWMNIKTLHAF